MVYQNLQIYTHDSQEIYTKISEILGVEPAEFPEDKGTEKEFSLWTYCHDQHENDPYFDFINHFLDILEPKLDQLKALGINSDDITYWYLYEFDKQCAMEFEPEDMKRLGKNGIALCIDCWPVEEDDQVRLN